MLGSSDVCATIAVKDMAVAAKFYEEVLGLTAEKPSDYGTLYKSGNSGVFVYPSASAGTNQATYAAWSVDDASETAKELKAKGVTFETYDGMPGEWQDGINVMGEMKSGWFKDPDGNILNIVSGM